MVFFQKWIVAYEGTIYIKKSKISLEDYKHQY